MPMRGYVSCVGGCPYKVDAPHIHTSPPHDTGMPHLLCAGQGDIDPAAVAKVAKALYDMGCYEVLGPPACRHHPQAQHRSAADCSRWGG